MSGTRICRTNKVLTRVVRFMYILLALELSRRVLPAALLLVSKGTRSDLPQRAASPASVLKRDR